MRSETSHSPKWQRERAALLHCICRWIQARSERGQTVLKSVSHFAKAWHGRAFKSHPRYRLKLSTATLRRIYYAWLKHGQTAFALHFAPGGQVQIPASYLQEVICRAARPEVFSLNSVLRSIEADWQMGKRIPGLGTWRTWAKRHGCKVEGRKLPLPLPFKNSVYRHFAGIQFQKRRAIQRQIVELTRQLRAIDRQILSRAKP